MPQLQKSTGIYVFIWAQNCKHTPQRAVFSFGNVCFVEVRNIKVRLYLHESLSPVMSGSAEASVDRLCDLCDSLHGALEEADMLGRSCARRPGILRTLFRLIDLDSAQLNLRIAELCLAVSFLCKCGCVGVCCCHCRWAMWAAGVLNIE